MNSKKRYVNDRTILQVLAFFTECHQEKQPTEGQVIFLGTA